MFNRLPILTHSLTALTLLMAGVGWSRADETAGEESAPPSADEATQPEKKEDQPAKPSVLDKLSKELFKELDDPAGDAAAEKENKLDRIAKGMRNAGEKLDGEETGDDTRNVQKQVIKDLEDLINQLQNPPPQGGGGGGGGGGSASLSGKTGLMQKQQGSGQSGKTGSASGQPQAGQGTELNKSGGQDRKDAQGSEERSESERKAAEDAARKKKLEMDVWGHLPPHMREQLLNTYGERMLPKYQQLVKQFYESLSEQSNPPPRR